MPSIKDFSYKKEDNSIYKNNTNEKTNQQKASNINTDQMQNYNELLSKYKDMPQNQLMQELLSEATKQKANGTLNDESLAKLQKTLSPMLSNEQNEMLNNIISKIK